MFTWKNKIRIAKGICLKSNPLYVQFYITARCNLTCEQCNIIYANSDVRECRLDEIEKIAANLSKVGVAIVLLTGGEPFVRKDLPEIVRAFHRQGIHVRMQTNGLASEEALAACVKYGGNDISISLDSLRSEVQDSINGQFAGSWKKALETIAKVTRHLPKKRSFAAFGCVLSPHNLEDVEEVIRFGTAIGWHTSLVPIHITHKTKPMNFRTYDQHLAFQPEDYPRVDALMDKFKKMKREGFLIYDSDEYLENIKTFVRNDPISWRRHNDDVCDSPKMYFAIIPNGDFAVCCDHRLPGGKVPTQSVNFPEIYRSREFRDRAVQVAKACEGCMFGSYPEITITARYWEATLERLTVFLEKPPPRPWPLTPERLAEIASDIRAQKNQPVDAAQLMRRYA